MTEMDLARRLQALEDANAIRELKVRYFWCCDRKDPRGFRACFVDGPVHIDYGRVGTFEDADALTRVFTEVGTQEHMVEMHHGMNPQIKVLDGQRATGTWSLHYFLIDTRARSATQLGGYYEDEYRKVGGDWKISRTKFVATSTLALDLSDTAAVKTMFAGKG